MQSTLAARCALFAALVLAAPAEAGQVLRLGAGAQTLHADPQAAVDAADDGDVLLFEAGTYPGFVVSDVSLTIAALPDAVVTIQGAVEVRFLNDAQRVVVSGLTVIGPADPSATTPNHALWVRSADGLVVVQDCTLQGNGCGSTFAGGFGLRITDSPSVAVLNCTVRGGSGGCGPTGAYAGGNAIRASAAGLLVQGSQVFGGAGEDADGINTQSGGDGATGLALLDSLLFAAGSTIRGGAGGDGDGFFDPAGSGGNGLYIDPGSTAHLLDVVAIGGSQGFGLPASDGEDISDFGALFQHPGSARGLLAPRSAIEDETLALAIEGDAGDLVWARTGLETGWVPAPGLAGVWIAPKQLAKLRAEPLAALSSGGSANLAYPPLAVTSPVGARNQVLQLYALSLVDGAVIGGARSVLRFDRDAAPDCDGNGVFDVVDMLAGGGDCNGDWQLDTCQIALGQLPDCNANLVPDACDISAGTSLDLNFNGVPDECEGQTVWHVDAGAPAGGDGSASSPFQTLGEAFTTAISGDEITVAAGTYTGAANRELDFGGRSLCVRAPSGTATTVVDAQGLGRVFRLSGGEGPGTRIEGFTLRNGVGSAAGTNFGGGAISAYQASFEVVDCVFEDCASSAPGGFLDGGGLNAVECTVLVDECRFHGNDAQTGFGGGLALRDCLASVVRGSRFANNFGARRGGGLHSWDSELTVVRCTFLSNEADLAGFGEGGGAAYVLNFDRPTTLANCLFAGNSAVASGGALNLSTFATPIVVADCTFSGNSSTAAGGGLAAFNVELVNSVLWSNSAPSGAELHVYSGPVTSSSLWVDRSLVAGGQGGVTTLNNGVLVWGAGNLSSDPMFVDSDGVDDDALTIGDNDYRLLSGSPALDAGDNTLVPADTGDLDGDGVTTEPLPLDLDLLPRFQDLPGAPDVGFGAPPLVDLGCYERQS